MSRLSKKHSNITLSLNTAFQQIGSGDARALISCCRPIGQFSHRRQTGWNQDGMPTQTHQSSVLSAQPFHPAQDVARGMFQDTESGMITSLVGSQQIRSELFDLRTGEREAVAKVLPCFFLIILGLLDIEPPIGLNYRSVPHNVALPKSVTVRLF